MGRNDSAMASSFLKFVLALLLVLGTAATPVRAANDLPLAAGSPLAGFSFDDRPLALPVQRNFQMAMLTASSELGRSCGKMESYGWRMNQSEQRRVDQIFNNTVDRLRGLGYVVETQAPTSVSRDITMFTADRSNKHFIFMWSAGEIGLVMVLCEASPPLSGRTAMTTQPHSPSVEVFPVPDMPVEERNRKKAAALKFSPVGDWIGHYTCEQGYTGGTLQIAHLNGENFDGYFRFYPTPKNPYVPTGRYTVYGQYDRESHRILINPGEWLERPKDFYNTIMVGSFDPATRTFSAYFQGIMGCTSFEAKYATEDYEGVPGKAANELVKKKAKKKKPAVKKPAVKIKPAETKIEVPVVVEAPAAGAAVETVPAAVTITPAVVITPAAPAAPAPSAVVAPASSTVAPPAPAPASIVPAVAPAPSAPAITAPAAVITPAVVAPVAAPTVTAPVEAVSPVTIILPAPAATPQTQASPAASSPVPASAAPVETPPPPPAIILPAPAAPATSAPMPLPAPASTPDTTAPKPTGSLEPHRGTHDIVVASSGTWFTPTVPPAPTANYITPIAPQVPSVPIAPTAQTAPSANYITPTIPQVQPAPILPSAPEVPQAVMYDTTVPVLPAAPTAPAANYITPYVQQVPPPEMVPDTGGPHP